METLAKYTTLEWALYAIGNALLAYATYRGQSLTLALTQLGGAFILASGVKMVKSG